MRASGRYVQVRLSTRSTGEDYVTGKLWTLATLECCPWHPNGGCGFCRHGTYPRVRPSGTLIARWYCPTERRTVSALPDCLASHFSGTLDELEGTVCAVEQARSLAAAALDLRTDIFLPGALRYLSRVCRAIHRALGIIRGLAPDQFATVIPTLGDFAVAMDCSPILMSLREKVSRYLPQLPIPLGFNPSRSNATHSSRVSQHQTGSDPPQAFVDGLSEPVADRIT